MADSKVRISNKQEQEIWKDIPGYDGMYEVSNYGRVRSWKNARWGRRGRPRKKSTRVHEKGYVLVQLPKNGRNFTKRVHRLVAEAFVPNPLKKPQVNHIDGNKFNNRAENLEWVTNQENRDHAVQFGLQVKGEEHGRAILTEEEVLQIRELCREDSLLHTEIAEMFGVSAGTIGDIRHRRSWVHL